MGLICAGCASKTNASPLVTQTPVTIPPFAHIYTIVLENKAYDSIIGNAKAPYLNSLIEKFGLAVNYSAITHPSQPNYLALFSGSTQGITDDNIHNLDGRNLVDQLEAHGKTWRVFAQNMPLGCFTGATALNGPDGAGEYARKHNPAISFTNISQSPARCANLTDFNHFDPTVDYSFIVPNQCNGMHDCPIEMGDKFLRGFLPKILGNPVWLTDSVIFIVFDEANEKQNGDHDGGHVPLVVISNRVPKGYRSPIAYNHYSYLRTIQDAWNLGCLNETCNATSLIDFFR